MAEHMCNNYFEVTWTIDKFSPCLTNLIFSPIFTVEHFNHTNWYLELCLDFLNAEQYMTCHLSRLANDDEDDKIEIECKIELENEQGQILASQKSSGEVSGGQNLPFRYLISALELWGKCEDYVDNFLLVRCHMTSKSFYIGKFTKCRARTKISADYCSFKWLLSNFDLSPFKANKIYFTHGYHFRMNISTCDAEDDFKINICLIGNKDDELQVFICKIFLLNVDESGGISKNFYSSMLNIEQKFPDFIKKSLLLTDKARYVNNNAFTLLCELQIIKQDCSYEIWYDNNNIACDRMTVIVDSFNVLKDDFRCMLNNHTQSDLVLKIGDSEFRAHKCVLSARSPVFCAMLNQNMLEKKTGTIEIRGMDSEVLKTFLGFLYTGEVNDTNPDNVLKLLLAADKYQVSSLKEECSVLIMNNLTDQNVCEILTIADMVNHEALKTSCLNYVQIHSSKILSSTEWTAWVRRNMELATEVICHLSSSIVNKN